MEEEDDKKMNKEALIEIKTYSEFPLIYIGNSISV